ncbi:MAG: hypothetical protein KA792_05370 [Bacteroidales bacterium]|nr:hypothetical protein [Bacteroidales bacterium]
MEIEVLQYNLPDISLLKKQIGQKSFIIWRPDKIYIVLGVSNNKDDSLIEENVLKDNIIVLKRPSGGETVVLTPQTIVISAIDENQKYINPKDCFAFYNNKIISALKKLGVQNLSQKGISDISIKDKKILGSSIYRSKSQILYQSVLNVNENPELFEKYLKHPKREPDYRKNRKHSDFVTSIYNEGYTVGFNDIIYTLNNEFNLIESKYT